VGEVLELVRGELGGHFGETCKGRFNQPQGIKHESGLTVHYGAQVEAQPVVVEMPGEACECFLDSQISEMGCNLEGRMTRLDLAEDAEPAQEARSRLMSMHELWKGGEVDTGIRITSMDLIQSNRPGQGWTMYCGSRQSPLFMRAYDKRGPLRIEWEFKPQGQIRGMMPRLLREGGPTKWWRWMARHAVWPLPWYEELLSGPLPDARLARAPASSAIQSLQAIRHQWGPKLDLLLKGGLRPEDLTRVPRGVSRQGRYEFREFAKSAAQALDLNLERMIERVEEWRS
jgi:hypothetical protein